MKFTKRSIAWRKQLERKKQLVEILGGKCAATHGTAQVPMRHATKPPLLRPASKSIAQGCYVTTPAPLTPQEFNRRAYARRKGLSCETVN
jgi:hypothetical protein